MVLCLALALVVQARPPYLLLALLPLAAGVPRWARLAGCAAVLASVIAWSAASLRASGADVAHFHGSDAHAQALLLAHAPWRLPVALFKTLGAEGSDFVDEFLGRLGWLDVHMPQSYRFAALLLLGLAAMAGRLAGRGWLQRRRALVCAGCLLGAALGVFVIQDLTWTPPGGTLIEGVQGRYFLPLALLAAVLLAPRVPGRIGWIAWPVLLFPVVSIVVAVHRITLRYYF